jgi:hypothetical protein
MKTERILRFSFLLAIAIFFSSLTVGAATTNDDTSKTTSRTFTVGVNDLLSISNSFGNITVTHWDKNEAEIRVVVEAKARNKQAARESLDRVNITLNKSGNKISGTTTIRNNSSDRNQNLNVDVNYYISIPSQMAIELNQKYGTINLPENNNGTSNITVKYGKLFAGNFSKHLDLDIAYSDATFKNLTTAKMELAYSNATLGSANKIKVKAKYSKTNSTNKVNEFELEDRYGTITLNEINQMIVDAKYSKVTVNKLSKSFAADNFQYSNLSIKELASDFDRIEASAKYGTVDITISSDAAFRINAENMRYGSVKLTKLNSTNSATDRNSQKYEINGSGKGIISFDGGNYGDLIIKGK